MKKYRVTLVVDTPYPPKKEDVEFYMASDDATVLFYVVDELEEYSPRHFLVNDKDVVSRGTLKKKGPKRRGYR